MVYTMYLNTEA